MKYRLGDTVRFMRPQKFYCNVNESLRQFFEEEAWHNGQLDYTPKHILDQWIDVVLSTSEMVDEYNDTGYLIRLAEGMDK